MPSKIGLDGAQKLVGGGGAIDAALYYD